MKLLVYLLTLVAATIVASCSEEKKQQLTPWGTTLEAAADSIPDDFTLDDILNNGELIMLTLTGPETYYDYHGKGMGTQYMLCEKFASALGVSLRVEVCKDTTDLLTRLDKGEGDIIALALPEKTKGVRICGARDAKRHQGWAVQADNVALADTLDRWYRPSMLTQVRQEMEFMLSTRSVTRHVYSPMLNRSAGIISQYDHLFQKYAPVARWDWRLLAAQCYQESTFDPKALSWVEPAD